MIRGIEALKHISETDKESALKGACKEFESIFAHQILKTMGESMPDGMFESGLASDFYKDMLFKSVADKVAETGSLGIGDIILRRLESLSANKGE